MRNNLVNNWVSVYNIHMLLLAENKRGKEKMNQITYEMKHSLVWRMTFLMTLLLIIPITVLGIFYIQSLRNTVESELSEELAVALEKMTEELGATLKEAEDYLDELEYRIELPYYLDENTKMSQQEMDYYILKFQEEAINSRYIYGEKFGNIAIYSENQQIEESAYLWLYYLDDLEKKRYFDEIKVETQESIYGAVRDYDLTATSLDLSNLSIDESGAKVLPIYRKVYSLNTDELVGVIELDIRILHLIEASFEIKDGPSILLLNSSNEILYDEYNFSTEDQKTILNEFEEVDTKKDIQLSDGMYTIQYEKNEETDLVCVSIISKQEMIEYQQREILKIVGVVLVCVILMSVITYSIIKNVLKRLVVLDKMLRKVGQGDFSVSISDDNSGDEVSRITRTFNGMASKLEKLLESEVEKEKIKKEAEVRALQAQINPHFLYNTLENMRMQCEIDEYYTIANSLSVLGDLFRYSISWNTNEVPFRYEWKNLHNYLEIMHMRFDEDLEACLECDSKAEEIIVPKLILQPLVENCFNHGFKGKLPPWKISVKVEVKEEILRIAITDNGVGIPKEKLKMIEECFRMNKPYINSDGKKQSIGIVNVNHRIAMMCKEGSKMSVKTKEEKGTTIKIEIMT